MSSMPECVKCGDYIYHGGCLCYDHAKELYQWVFDVLERGVTDKLRERGEKFVKTYTRLLEDEAYGYVP